jgi:hypothetical protein
MTYVVIAIGDSGWEGLRSSTPRQQLNHVHLSIEAPAQAKVNHSSSLLALRASRSLSALRTQNPGVTLGRGTTMATNRLISILLGTGLIPVMTGAISDAIGGAGSIRLALLFTTSLLPLCTYCYAMIYRILPRKEQRESMAH